MENYNELYHYGIKGMKWGVRRYQNADGSLTSAGRKKAKQEYKNDNRTAYEIGKSATIYGHAAAKSLKRTAKLEQKLDKQYEKDPSGSKRRTESLKKKLDASSKTSVELKVKYLKLQDIAEKHCDSLIKKYGKEAVSSIKYTDKKVTSRNYTNEKFKTINEKTNNMSDYAEAGVKTMTTSAILTLMGSPFSFIYIPKSTDTKARELERDMYRANRKEQRG